MADEPYRPHIMTQEELDAQDAYFEELEKKQQDQLRRTGTLFMLVTLGGAVAFTVLQYLGLGLSWWWIAIPLGPLGLIVLLTIVFTIAFPGPVG